MGLFYLARRAERRMWRGYRGPRHDYDHEEKILHGWAAFGLAAAAGAALLVRLLDLQGDFFWPVMSILIMSLLGPAAFVLWRRKQRN